MDNQKTLDEKSAEKKAFIEWDIENDLPSNIGPYVLERTDEQDGRIYKAFRWIDHQSGWEVRAVFDGETAEYMIKIDLNFMTFTQIEVISSDFETFKENVKKLTPGIIEKELIKRDHISVLIKDKGFVNWKYETLLPARIETYERVIEPKNPITGLNGSYIIAAYQCKDREAAMIFFYNVYRDEYYGEMRSKGIPLIMHKYDSQTIDEFSKALKSNLEKDLQDLYERS